MKKAPIAKELRAVILAVIALIVVLIVVLAISGRKLAGSGMVSDGTGNVTTAAERQRQRAAATFVYGKYGALWRYDGGRTTKLANLPNEDEDEELLPILVNFVALTADEKTVYFVDMNEDYDVTLYRGDTAGDGQEKIVSHIDAYAVYNSDLFYLKENGALYKNEERIATNVDSVETIVDDGGRLLFIDRDGRLFLLDTDDPDGKQRIDRQVLCADLLSADLSSFFYVTQDDELLLYDAGNRTSLGTFAWEYGDDLPTKDTLFYWADDEEDDASALYYYDAEQGESIRLFDSEGGETLRAIGVFPDERLLWAVTDDGSVREEDNTFRLLRRPLGRNGNWTVVEEDLDEIPQGIVCDKNGRFYYLQETDALHAEGRELDIDADGIFGGGGAVWLISDVDADAETFTVSALDGTKKRKIADDVYLYRVLSDGTLVTLRDFSERRGEGDLYVTKGGKDVLVDRDVVWFSDGAYD